MRILVADDDPTIRLLVSEQLSRHGHEVTTVEDGEQALSALETTSHDLLVLDVMMPVVDGWTVLEKVRRSSPRPVLPVILLTARDTRDDVRRGHDLGASTVLSKAHVLEQLVDTVNALTGTALIPR